MLPVCIQKGDLLAAIRMLIKKRKAIQVQLQHVLSFVFLQVTMETSNHYSRVSIYL